MTTPSADALEQCRRLAIQQNLTFVKVGATHEHAERYAVMDGRLCLMASDRLGDAEHFLFGYREARATEKGGRS